MIDKFVVYSIARVGSNFFINQLNNHPQILCHYEIFHPLDIYSGFTDKKHDDKSWTEKWNITLRDENPDQFLSELFGTYDGETSIGYFNAN